MHSLCRNEQQHLITFAGKKVFFYDGSWECYQGFHLGFFIVALFVIILFVALPLILLVVIVHNGAGRRYLCFTIETPVIDAITQGLRLVDCFLSSFIILA